MTCIIHRYVETGTQGNINAHTVKNLNIKLPTSKEQDLISSFFNYLDYQIENLNKKIKEYKKFKRYLLQKMFI